MTLSAPQNQSRRSADVDAIYVSHLHPDHYDERYFDFPKNIPIFALDHGPAFLITKLQDAGYSNIIALKNGETTEFLDFKVTLFAPFSKHNFHEADVGNLIDNAMVLEADGRKALNANDNTPTVDSCKSLVTRFGSIDLAMLNYNAAGPYPACFNNLTEQEKRSDHSRILDRNFTFMKGLIEALDPKYALPFAGAYVLGGKQHTKNPYLGTATWDECARYLRGNLSNQSRVICLRENDVFDLDSGAANRPYVPI